MATASRQRCLAVRGWALIGLLALMRLPLASAHKGPPFPLLMDEPLGAYVVSVWADPDIGDATFFIIVETPQGQMPSEAPEVSMWVEPVSKRLDRVTNATERESLRNQMQFTARPYFDQGDMWTVGFRLTGADGETGELTVDVESTPPGFGPWDLAIYLFPFLLLGGLWGVAMRRRARMARMTAKPPERIGAIDDTRNKTRTVE